MVAADEFERTGMPGRAQPRAHARATRSRRAGGYDARARRGGRGRARLRGAASPARSSASRRAQSTRRHARARRSGCPTRAPPGLQARRAAGADGARQEVGGRRSRSCSPARTGSSASTIPTGAAIDKRSRGRSRSDQPDGDDPLAVRPEPEPARRARARDLRHHHPRGARRRSRARPRPKSATSSSTCSRTTRATLIDAIHGARGRCAAIVINAGAFTHYVYALADALARRTTA